MATEAELQQQRVSEFMRLLPLTLAIAGLPQVSSGHFTEGQMEARAMSLRQAYKVARQIIREVAVQQ